MIAHQREPGSGRPRCKQKFTQTPRTLGLKTLGFFVYRTRKYRLTEKIDYNKIADRIVEQVVEHSRFVLDDHAMQRLLQGKIDRAQQAIKARATCPVWHTDR